MTEQCNRCRFWLEDMKERDPNDANWGFGRCRLRPPVISESYVAAFIPKLEYGQQCDPDIDTTSLSTASLYPATHSTDWCGSFEMSPSAPEASPIQAALADWKAFYRELSRIPDSEPESVRNVVWAKIDAAEKIIWDTPSTSPQDSAAKLRVALVHRVSGAIDEDIVVGRRHAGELTSEADPGERATFAAMLELEAQR